MRRLIPSLAIAATVTSAAMAGPSTTPFVAPGLWEIITDVHGPMQQHSQVTQEQCWNAQGETGQDALPASASGAQINGLHTVENTDDRSTVHLQTISNMPQGQMRQDTIMVFSRGSGSLHHATMTGRGSMTWSKSPMLDETYTQHGRWLAAVCPSTLPPAKKTVLRRRTVPALTALQDLAARMHAMDPHPNGP